MELNYVKRSEISLLSELNDIVDLEEAQNYIPIYGKFFNLTEGNYNMIQLNNSQYLSNIESKISDNIYKAKVKTLNIMHTSNVAIGHRITRPGATRPTDVRPRISRVSRSNVNFKHQSAFYRRRRVQPCTQLIVALAEYSSVGYRLSYQHGKSRLRMMIARWRNSNSLRSLFGCFDHPITPLSPRRHD